MGVKNCCTCSHYNVCEIKGKVTRLFKSVDGIVDLSKMLEDTHEEPAIYQFAEYCSQYRFDVQIAEAWRATQRTLPTAS